MDQKILNLNKLYSGKNVPTVRPPLVIGTLASTGSDDLAPLSCFFFQILFADEVEVFRILVRNNSREWFQMKRVDCDGDEIWMKDYFDHPCHHSSFPPNLGKERKIVENFLRVFFKLAL